MKRKDYAFRRQFNEEPSILPGCPGGIRIKSLNGIVASLIMMPSAIVSLVATTSGTTGSTHIVQLSHIHMTY